MFCPRLYRGRGQRDENHEQKEKFQKSEIRSKIRYFLCVFSSHGPLVLFISLFIFYFVSLSGSQSAFGLLSFCVYVAPRIL